LIKFELLYPKKGFTLVELILAVVIIGIVVLTALPIITDIQWQARVSATKRGWADEYQLFGNGWTLDMGSFGMVFILPTTPDCSKEDPLTW